MRSHLLLCVATLALMSFSTRASAQDCYESAIVSPTPFMGNNGEILKLADGSLWEVKYEYEYLYEYYPAVVVCPSRGRLIVGGKSLNVELVARAPGSKMPASRQTEEWETFEETNLEGSISGTVQRGRIFKTTSGNVYEVTGLTLQLVLELQPEVTVLRKGDVYKLIVNGFDEPLVSKCFTCSKSEAQRDQQSQAQGTVTSNVVESHIISDFDGLDHGNVYKLANGQVWEQTEYWIWVWVWVNPQVIIWSDGGIYRMKVEGIDHPVMVRRIK